MTGTTDANGFVTFDDSGPCGTGALEFLVTGAHGAGRHLDRTLGRLSIWKIPR